VAKVPENAAFIAGTAAFSFLGFLRFLGLLAILGFLEVGVSLGWEESLESVVLPVDVEAESLKEDEFEEVDNCEVVLEGSTVVFLRFGVAGVIFDSSRGSTILASAMLTCRTTNRSFRSILDLNLILLKV
jgi:hypothetical protein